MYNKPVIGIVLNREMGGEGQYSLFPWYALRCNYSDCITKAGGVPIFIPYDHDNLEVYANMIQGLVIAGGAFDVPAELYGENNHVKTLVNNDRTNFEYALLKKMIDSNKPILGVCGGHQLINVFFGGTLIQHIPDITSIIDHEQKIPKDLVSHEVVIEKNTKLYEISKTTKRMVNSTHHQAIAKLGKGLKLSAFSPSDEIVEAIEHESHPFCIGVQWHPEYLSSEEDEWLFNAFIKVAN